MEQEFKKTNAYVIFIFFVGAIGITMFIRSVDYLLVSLISSMLLLLSNKQKKTSTVMMQLSIVFLCFTFISPLFSVRDWSSIQRISEQAYNSETLSFALVNALLLVSVISWCINYQYYMTSDKFILLFGKIAPTFTLVMNMILRLTPHYLNKYKQIYMARNSIGLYEEKGIKGKLINMCSLLASLSAIGFEEAIISADSMKSRGFGLQKRTSYLSNKMNRKDIILAFVLCILLFISIICINMQSLITHVSSDSTYNLIGLIAFLCYAMIPLFINKGEEILWNISKSRI